MKRGMELQCTVRTVWTKGVWQPPSFTRWFVSRSPKEDNNNNRKFMAPHLMRAQGAYKANKHATPTHAHTPTNTPHTHTHTHTRTHTHTHTAKTQTQ